MRTTLTLDDDILAAAQSLAAQQRRSLGAVVSSLARQGLRREVPYVRRNGIPLLPSRGRGPITLEMVNALRDEPNFE